MKKIDWNKARKEAEKWTTSDNLDNVCGGYKYCENLKYDETKSDCKDCLADAYGI